MASTIRGKQLQTYRVSQSLLDGARFSTIQAAINQAVSDGATGASPAEILISPGIYVENPTASNGGIILRGCKVRGQGVAISGNFVTTNNAGGAVNVYAIVGCNLSGTFQNTGLSLAGTILQMIESTSTGFTCAGATGPSVNVFLQNSRITGAGADIVLGNSVTEWDIQDSQILANISGRSFQNVGSATVINTNFQGYVESSSGGSNANFDRCTFTTDGNPGYVSASTSTERVQLCAFDRAGAAGPAIATTGAGVVQISGNTVKGSVSNPYVVATAGSFDRGDPLEGQRTELNSASSQQQPIINFVEGSNITIVQTLDAANGRVSYEISAAGGATPNWATVLAAGALSGANNPIIQSGQFLQIGNTSPATAGDLRADNGFTALARNNAGTGNLGLIQATASDAVIIGDSSNQTQSVETQAQQNFTATIAGTQRQVTDATRTTFSYGTNGGWQLQEATSVGVGFSALFPEAVSPGAGNYAFASGASATDTRVNAATGGSVGLFVNNSELASFSATEGRFVTSYPLEMGAGAAQSGIIRLRVDETLSSRDAAGTGDIALIGAASGNIVTVGQDTTIASLNLRTLTQGNLFAGGNQIASWNSSSFSINPGGFTRVNVNATRALYEVPIIFGTPNSTRYMQLGDSGILNYAQSGWIRTAANETQIIVARNNANSADINVLGMRAADIAELNGAEVAIQASGADAALFDGDSATSWASRADGQVLTYVAATDSLQLQTPSGGTPTGGQETFNLSNYSASLNFGTGTGTIFYVRIVAQSSFTATRMACWIFQTAAFNLAMAIYDSSNNRLAQTAQVAAGANRTLQLVNLTSTVAISAGTEYFIALWVQASSSIQFASIGGRASDDTVANIQNNQNGGPPATRSAGGPSTSRPYIAVLSAA